MNTNTPLSTATLRRPGQIRTKEQLEHHLHNTGGQHFPFWIHKDAIHHVMPLMQSGHAIPHPGIPIPMPQPQQQQPPGYADGGVITGMPIAGQQIDQGAIAVNANQQPMGSPGLGTSGGFMTPNGVQTGQPVGDPSANFAHPPPRFLGPPVQAPTPSGMPRIGGAPRQWPSVGNAPANPHGKLNKLATGGVVKKKSKLDRK